LRAIASDWPRSSAPRPAHAPDLYELRVIDEIIPEPLGGAHADHEATAKSVQDALCRQLDELRRFKPDKLVRRRREKFQRLGQFVE
jgi:acetyl-CoA carboxylase carboxyl transferase subunit alpha